MSSTNSNRKHDLGELGVKAVKLEQDFVARSFQQNEYPKFDLISREEPDSLIRRHETEYDRKLTILSAPNSGASVLDKERFPIDDSSFCSKSSICPAPICRQFWKVGNYEDRLNSKPRCQNIVGDVGIHPKFLHSNANSHKWVFGAMADLLDNSVDEVQNGATFVIVDKTSNPRDGTPALLIQDDGGGMDPEAMRHCLSFGFPDKRSKIGQYGNGLKTNSMRLGADVVVFSRAIKDRKLTQIVGLLSYTFLMQTRQDRIVVPMVDYQFNSHARTWNKLHNEQPPNNNLSILLQWSPVTTEAELLKQFDDIGPHGTKIIVYNLWHNDDGKMELDFESDPEDIRISGKDASTAEVSSQMEANELHLANRLKYSLRAYLSILYLRVPANFCIFLCGRVVEYHSIANDLKFPEFIVYRPQNVEGSVITTIGFLKEAPAVNVHGFNVYHKNRLILPFWHVVTYSDGRGRGVVGVLEANFIEPTCNKQEFEKTAVFQKLETRLKEMTQEYWDYHCGLIGYRQVMKNPQTNMVHHSASDSRRSHGIYQPVMLATDSSGAIGAKASLAGGATQEVSAPLNCVPTKSGISVPSFHQNSQGATLKRKRHERVLEPEKGKGMGGMGSRPIDSAHGETVEGMILELTRKAADLLEEHENLKKEKELAAEEYNSLKVINEFLKAQLAEIKKAEAGDMEEKPSTLVAHSTTIHSLSVTNDGTNTYQSNMCSCPETRLHEDDSQLLTNQNMKAEVSNPTTTMSGDTAHRARFTLPPDSGPPRSFQVDDTADVNVVSTPETTRHGLLWRNQELIICFHKKPQDVFPATEAGKRKEFMKLKNVLCGDLRTHFQVDDTPDADVDVVSTPETTRHGLPQSYHEPIICPHKKPEDGLPATEARRRRKKFMKLKNVYCHDVRTRYQVDDTADVTVVSTPEATRYVLSQRNQEPIICLRKRPGDVFADSEARRREDYDIADVDVVSTPETRSHGLSQSNQMRIICLHKKPRDVFAIATKAWRRRRRKEFMKQKNVCRRDVQTRFQIEDTADVVVSALETTPQSWKQELIICPLKKPEDVFAATEAQRTGKEFMKLKNDETVAEEQVCDKAAASPGKTQKIAENIPSQLCSTSCQSIPVSKLKGKLTEAEKEEKKLRRILANRESAKKAFLRSQGMYLELTRKEADMLEENENLKKAKVLAVEEYNSLKDRNEFLKAQLAEITKAEAGETEEKPITLVTHGSASHPHSGTNDRTNTQQSNMCSCSETQQHEDNNQLLSNQNMKAEASNPRKTVSGDNACQAGLTLLPESGHLRSFQVDDAADANVVSSHETTRHGLPQRNQEPIICPLRKPEDVIPATEARQRRKEFMKLKNVHCHDIQTCFQVDGTADADVSVVCTPETKRHGLLQRNQEPIICPCKRPEDVFAAAAKARRRRRKQFMKLKNAHGHDLRTRYHVYNTADIDVVSTPETMRYGLLQRKEEPIICPHKEPENVFAATEARRRRKEFMKLKNVHNHNARMRQ